METAINSIGFELDETIKNRVEDVLASVNQWTQDLHKEFNVKTEETHLGLLAVTRPQGRASTKNSTSGSKKSWPRSFTALISQGESSKRSYHKSKPELRADLRENRNRCRRGAAT
jgi:predicted transposase YdaD